jgi:hypothetical protein
LLAGSIACLLIVAAIGSPDAFAAKARVNRFHDKAGDAKTGYDIRSAKVVRGKHAYQFQVHVRGLAKSGEVKVYAFSDNTGSDGNHGIFEVVRRKGKSTATVSLGTADFAEGSSHFPCAKAKIVWSGSNDVVKASMPYSCGFKAYFEAYDGKPASFGRTFVPEMVTTAKLSGKTQDKAGSI